MKADAFRLGSRLPSVGTLLALVVLAIALLCSIAPSVLASQSPITIHPQVLLRGPSWSHAMGTDQFGRDIASRVVYGSRSALMIGFGAVLLGGGVGGLVGIVAGFFGGLVDLVLMRLVEVVMAFPGLLLALAVVTAFGSGIRSVIGAIAIAAMPLFARIMRGETLKVRQEGYIESARVVGAGRMRIMGAHVVPNVFPTFLVLLTVTTGSAILLASVLSFLGLGVQGSTPDWGHMLSDGQDYMSVAWWVATMPGLAITTLVLSVNTLGDRLRDVLDPRSREAMQSSSRSLVLFGRRAR